jgi:hypothetical protein
MAACGVDVEQARLCEQIIGAFESNHPSIEILGEEIPEETDFHVRITYRAPNASEQGREHWVACRFGGQRFEKDRLELTAVATDRSAALSETELFWLKLWLDIDWELISGSPNILTSPTKSAPFVQALYFFNK